MVRRATKSSKPPLKRRRSKRRVKYDNIWKRYQITKEEWQTLLKKYKRRCAICKGKKRLTVDHSHKTGKVRGPLCNGCNLGIGQLRENVKVMKAAILYIRRHF